ncbi:hypothetical protein LIA77_03942 [Sarocladium implicatum]|nr:hypothetical protein LIA77_03942 [Sarocladium implicatum]
MPKLDVHLKSQPQNRAASERRQGLECDSPFPIPSSSEAWRGAASSYIYTPTSSHAAQ